MQWRWWRREKWTQNTRRFNNSRFNLSAPYPGIKTIKSARSLISSFSIRTNLLLIFMNPRCCCCSHFPKIRKRYTKSFSSLPTHSIVVVIVAVPYDYTHVEWTRSLNFCWTWATQFYPYFLHLHARSVCIMNNKQRHWRLEEEANCEASAAVRKSQQKLFPSGEDSFKFRSEKVRRRSSEWISMLKRELTLTLRSLPLLCVQATIFIPDSFPRLWKINDDNNRSLTETRKAFSQLKNALS